MNLHRLGYYLIKIADFAHFLRLLEDSGIYRQGDRTKELLFERANYFGIANVDKEAIDKLCSELRGYIVKF